MTPQAINIAIAEELGWQDVIAAEDGTVIGLPPGFTENQCPEGADQCVPNFAGSLDACALFETTLPPHHEQYAQELARILALNEEGELNDWDLWKVAIATAPQRCEAFLRLKGKWHETGS